MPAQGSFLGLRSENIHDQGANVNRAKDQQSRCGAGASNDRRLQGGALSDITNKDRAPQLDKLKPAAGQSEVQPGAVPAVVPRARAVGAAQESQQPAAAPGSRATGAAQVPQQPVVATPVPAAVQATNVQAVEEYVPDIVEQLFREETSFLPRPDYMNSQTDITPKMRMILIDWLVEVHAKYRLRSETLHLALNLNDRYLTRMPLMRKKLQLVGVVAMFIASKFEEINPPELSDWVYICDNAYTKEEVLVMECTMLSTLSFQIMVPTAAHFFESLQKANACDDVHREVVQYLLELGLLDIRMLQHAPSHRVAAALLLSNELLRKNATWPATMVHQSRHTEPELRVCADQLRQLLDADRAGTGGQLQAVHKKFSVAQRHAVANMQF